MTTLSQAERQRLLDKAVNAVTAYIAHADNPGLAADAPTRTVLMLQAAEAVTAAVTRGGHSHRLITSHVGAGTGLRIAQLIRDPDAYAAALVRERHAADVYTEQVMQATRAEAVRLMDGNKSHGAKSATAQRLGVSRPTLDQWLMPPVDVEIAFKGTPQEVAAFVQAQSGKPGHSARVMEFTADEMQAMRDRYERRPR